MNTQYFVSVFNDLYRNPIFSLQCQRQIDIRRLKSPIPLYITMLGREYPNVNCEIVFDKIEWQTAYIVLKQEKPPKKPPLLNEMIKLIASLGGFLNRSSDNNPGPSALWKGVKSLYEHVKAREAFELVFGHSYG